MKSSLSKLTARALTWRFLDFIAVKVVFLLRLLVLASLLTPEDFGLLAIGLSAVTLVLTLSDFGVEPALIQRQDVRQQDYDAGWTLVVARATFVTLVILLVAHWIADLFGEPRATPIIQALAIGVFIDSLASVKLTTLNRNLQFRSLALLNTTQAVVTTVVAILAAPVYGVWALVAGSLAGTLAFTLASYVAAPYRPRLRWHRASAGSLLNYGRWIFLTGVIVMLANTAMRAIISRHLGVAELGIFYLASRLAFLPYMAIVEVIESVTFPLYARLQDSVQKTRELFRTALLGTATLLIPACLLLAALAPGLIEDILGERWAGTTTAIQILALASPLGLLGYAIVPCLKGLGLPSRVSLLQVINSGLGLALVWLLVREYALLGAVTGILIATLLSQPLAIVFTRKFLRQPYAGLWWPLLMVTLVSLLGALLTRWLEGMLPGSGGFVVACCAGGITTLGLIFIADRVLNLGILYSLARHFPRIALFLRIETSENPATGISKPGKESI